MKSHVVSIEQVDWLPQLHYVLFLSLSNCALSQAKTEYFHCQPMATQFHQTVNTKC